MSYQYLIFDLDNTLYPKESGLLNQVNKQIDQFISLKLKIPTLKIPQLRQEYWKKYGTTLGGMVAYHRIDPDEYINYAYNVKITDFLTPDPGLVKVLAGINIKKVIFSNSPLNYVEDVLKVLQIRDLFEKIYDIRFCGYLGKPNLSSYFKVLADLKVEGKECLFIDDTPVNVLGAEAAGIDSVLLENNSVDGIKWRISSLMELPELIMKMEGQLTA